MRATYTATYVGADHCPPARLQQDCQFECEPASATFLGVANREAASDCELVITQLRCQQRIRNRADCEPESGSRTRCRRAGQSASSSPKPANDRRPVAVNAQVTARGNPTSPARPLPPRCATRRFLDEGGERCVQSKNEPRRGHGTRIRLSIGSPMLFPSYCEGPVANLATRSLRSVIS